MQNLWEWPNNDWFDMRPPPGEGAHAQHCLMARNWKLVGSKPIIILHEISDVSHTHESLITGLARSVCVPRMDKGRGH